MPKQLLLLKIISQSISSFKKVVVDEDKIEIAALPTKYPQGSERVLIKVLTNQTIVNGMLPADVGCIVRQCCIYYCYPMRPLP